MRATCVIALLGCLASLAAAAEQEFPYTAYVARREVAVRSGPGRNYYATDKLPAGDEVEVYRHEDDWCAIRPPLGSFSWVKSDDVRIGRDGIGIVLAEGAASRIGSNASEFRDVIQVRLERGEEVEVLDAVQVSNDNGVEFYCKIAPPSGEFRWVHKDDISREQPGPNLRDDADLAAPEERASRIPNTEPAAEERAGASDRWGSWVRARRSSGDRSDALAADAIEHRPASNRSRSIALTSSDEVAPADSDVKTVHQNEAALSEVEQIDRELSRIVVKDSSQWDLDAVRRRADDALAQATNVADRRKLGDLQDRIARFDDIRKRSVTLHGGESLRNSQSHPAETQPRASTESDLARYDGIGKLTPVVSQRPGAPRYALVNRANEVVTFVSPAPGVNLRSFEGEYVGISGQRGYMPELKKPHVTALRVNPLENAPSRVARR
ncbi:MAG: SH3 domain-containing protein [Pirellulales bacterium]